MAKMKTNAHAPHIFELMSQAARRFSAQSDNQDTSEKEKQSSRGEKLLAYFIAICLNVIVAVVIVLQWGSAPAKISLIAPFLLFSALFIVNAPIGRRDFRKGNLYLAIQTLLIIPMVAQNPVLAIMFFYPLSVQAMLKLNSRSALIWVGVFFFITAGSYWYLSDMMNDTFAFNTVVAGGGFFFFSALGGALAGMRKNREERRHLLTELTHAYTQLQEYARHAEALAVSEERNRLSRELHDTLGHRLTISIVQLEGVKKLLEQAPYREQVTRMVGTAHTQLIEGLDELRGTLHTLHGLQTDAAPALNRPPSSPAVADNHQTLRKILGDADNLIPSLQRLIHEFAIATGVNLHTQLPDTLPRLSAEQSITIYRAVQEALTNTHKHARARNAWVDMETMGGALTLTMRNDGLDFVPPSNGYGGYGLKGMRERATQLGGTLDVIKPEEGGILLTLNLPLDAE